MRTIQLVERVGGEVVRDEQVPATVYVERGRRDQTYVSYEQKTHREAFIAVVQASGAKWLPGTKQWELPPAKAAEVLAALAADGFEVSR